MGQNNSLAGTVVDVNGQPIEFANVILFSEDESEVLKGSSTNENGYFVFNALESKTYVLQVSFIGFTGFKQKIVLTGDL
ncbi:MAG: carboxypeptidase regulatory-like domain-containing protein, partial [Psychroserpens sp.]|nr:carboxypeptidase regulatory-like domain-containing protein [Psychroserpens sp.]